MTPLHGHSFITITISRATDIGYHFDQISYICVKFSSNLFQCDGRILHHIVEKSGSDHLITDANFLHNLCYPSWMHNIWVSSVFASLINTCMSFGSKLICS